MFVPFPWFVFYSSFFGDPVSGALAAAIHNSLSDDPRVRGPGSTPQSKPPEVPNVIATPGNYGDYDYD